MAGAARERIEVLPMLLGTSGGGQRFERPRTRAQRMAWGAYVGAIAERYGPRGTFWKEHPELEPKPLRAYQVWNEPNLPVDWRPVLDTAGYLRLVRLTRARVRRVDPKASIVLAGLPDSRRGTPSIDYVRAIYAQPGARSVFDVVALNPYSEDARGVLRLIFISLQDGAYAQGQERWWGPSVGLLDVCGRPKPAWSAFVGFTGGRAGGRLNPVAG